MRWFVRGLMRLFGWKIDLSVPQGIKKAVVVMAPHTSNWDFVIGRIAFYLMRIPGKFLIKKELFFFPLGWILRSLGALPVDRKKKNHLVSQAVELFKHSDNLYLVFTPEGTRAANPHWKKGFYYIALEAKVPIVLAFIDYSKKIGGFHGVFESTGNANEDIKSIKKELLPYEAKYPKQGIIF
ncbi:MAG: glycerol acyltransferase [Flavobacteriia bacterium]|nr:glycerol acyltransferase [Flavobacteriia bacterium]